MSKLSNTDAGGVYFDVDEATRRLFLKNGAGQRLDRTDEFLQSIVRFFGEGRGTFESGGVSYEIEIRRAGCR